MKTAHIASVCIASWSLLGCNGPDIGEAPAITKVVQNMGYTELQRQTDFMIPGTIVAIRSAAPFEAVRVCTQTGALGANFKPDLSDTLSSQWRRQSGGELKIAASYKAAINAKVGYEAVQEITLTLSNAKVYELTDESVIAAAQSGATSDACKIAIQNRFGQGLPMTMISAALQADVTYDIEFSEGISGEIQFALLQDIAPELSGNATVEGEDQVVGKKLIFGVIDDRQVLSSFSSVVSGLPQLATSTTTREQDKRLISNDLILFVSENEDSN